MLAAGMRRMTQAWTVRRPREQSFGWRTGAIAGIVGGVCYSIFIEAVTIARHGAAAFAVPFRQIAAVVLGPPALDAKFDTLTAIAAGTAMHLALAAMFGIALAWVAPRLTAATAGTLIALGFVSGLVLYAVDVFVIFPAAFPWFLENSRVLQSLAHALFGVVTGSWLAWRTSALANR